MVTRFLEFAKPDPLGCVAIDLRGIVERAAEDVAAAQFTLTGEFGVVNADDVLLRQAFSNLFRNSVEACSAVGRATQIAVDARADTRSESLVVSVKDNGPGLPEDAIDRVFQPFFTRRPGGTGSGSRHRAEDRRQPQWSRDRRQPRRWWRRLHGHAADVVRQREPHSTIGS